VPDNAAADATELFACRTEHCSAAATVPGNAAADATELCMHNRSTACRHLRAAVLVIEVSLSNMYITMLNSKSFADAASQHARCSINGAPGQTEAL
jgi:hypothetical protein